MKTAFSTILLLANCIFSYAQWSWVNPEPQGNDVEYVQFCDDNIGYAAAEYGNIIKTTDGGNSWTVIDKKLAGNINGLAFTSPINGFIISYFYSAEHYLSLLYHTDDGGLSWDSTIYDQSTFCDIQFIDSNIGFITGFEGQLLKTTDGGLTWNDISLQTTNDLRSVFFVNSQTGYITTGYDDSLYKTSDGGLTWTSISTSYVMDPLYFIDENVGFAIGTYNYKLMKTTNGGLSWRPVITDYIDAHSIIFVDSVHGFLGQKNGDIYFTSNAGETWTLKDYNGPSRYYLGMSFKNQQIGIMTGTSGCIATTNNGGTSWGFNAVITQDIYDVDFANDSTAFLSSSQSIFKSSDEGLNWESTFNLKGEGQITRLSFPTGNTGYIIVKFEDESSSLMKSTDGGISFSTILHDTDMFNDIHFFNENTGFLASGNRVYKTTDGGISWATNVLIEDACMFDGMHFISCDTGFIHLTAGDYSFGKVFKSVNGGGTWSEIFSEFDMLVSVFATNGSDIYICDLSGHIHISNDGGLSWSESDGLIVKGVEVGGELYFINDSTGYCLARNNSFYESTIYKTLDRGLSWNIDMQTSVLLWSFDYSETKETGLIVGDAGAVLHTATGSNVGAKIQRLVHKVTVSPNPSTSEITFNLPDSFKGPLSFTIYNSNGHCINRNKFNGTSHHIDISSLNPGLYLLKILSSSEVATGKFIVE